MRQPLTDTADVRVTIRPLRPGARPCFVTRHDGMTLLTIDPTAGKLEVADYCAQRLTTEEFQLLRRGYGAGPIGTPAPDCFMEGTVFLYVPAALRLPGAPAVQGSATTLDEQVQAFLLYQTRVA